MGPFVLAGQQATAAYRIILCSEKFCALYRDGEVVTVPLATITWASSQPSGLKAP
jgi:hypothetical protein